MNIPKSMGVWQKRWFYAYGLEADLPAFSGGSPLRLNSRESPTYVSKSTKLLLDATASLKDNGLTGR